MVLPASRRAGTHFTPYEIFGVLQQVYLWIIKKQNQDLLEEKVQCARSRRLEGLTSHASFIPTTAEPQLPSTCFK